MEGLILILVALGALLAFGAGIILLVMYFRSGRESSQPVRYGNLVQCPRCGYMNPGDSAACLNCRQPFTHTRQPIVPPAPTPTYPTIPPTASYQPPPPSPSPLAGRGQPPQTYVPPAGATVRRQVAPEPRRTPPAPMQPPVSAAAPGVMPTAWLEGVAGVMAEQRVVLAQADTMVGRSTVCDVQIYDAKVSRKHFLIRYANGAFFLQDQESSRGTFINGERVMAQRLNNGDRIELGDSSLIFHVE